MLTRAHRQEALSRAYIHAVAGAAGFACSKPDYDYGIDLTIRDIKRVGQSRTDAGYTLDVQAKSTTTALVNPTHVLYDIEVKAYDLLRDPTFGGYRVLVALVLPDEESGWIEQTEDVLQLRRAAYWLSLRGMAATMNTKSVRLSIPRANLFSIDALNRLMDKVRKREEL